LGSRRGLPVRLLSKKRRGGSVRGTGLSRDARSILAVQAARGVVYGLGSIVIGVSLEQSGLSTTRVGLVFTAMIAGAWCGHRTTERASAQAGVLR
jgi:hypothetical protein